MPDGGEVKLDGKGDLAVLRRRVAVVDAPGITEPDDALPVKSVVGEELAIAGRKAGGKAVQAWLESHEAAEHADKRFEHLPVDVRTRLLAELTVARPDVKVVILTMPDRFGGDPHSGTRVGKDLASRGYAVLDDVRGRVGAVARRTGGADGAVNQPDPVKVEPAQVSHPTKSRDRAEE